MKNVSDSVSTTSLFKNDQMGDEHNHAEELGLWNDSLVTKDKRTKKVVSKGQLHEVLSLAHQTSQSLRKTDYQQMYLQ